MKVLYRKKVLVSLAVALISYILLKYRKYNITYDAVVPHVQPADLWEFVSDFSNMKKLNPTITNFEIINESGNYEHWKYKVYYTEYLSQLPSFTNFAWADFEVKKLDNNTYAIYSKHKTCFITSFFCVNTDSTFTVQSTRNPSESKYTESIWYECPTIFSSFCKKEVAHQRRKIRDNLIATFKSIAGKPTHK